MFSDPFLSPFLDLFLDHFLNHFLDQRPDGKAGRPDTGAETSSFLVISMIISGSKSARTAKVLGPPKGQERQRARNPKGY